MRSITIPFWKIRTVPVDSDTAMPTQLAALEIADGSDTENMPAMLESIRTSVARTVEVLEQLSAEPPKAPRGGKRGGR